MATADAVLNNEGETQLSSIDVIVPCYNYGHFLRECVDSVLGETRIDVRVLILDDASPDNTHEIAENLAANESRITFVRHTTNRGHIATYNEGIEWISADYALLLSADDYVLPGALFRAVDLMDQHPEIGFTFGKAVEFLYEEGKDTRPAIPASDQSACRILTGREFIDLCGSLNPVHTPTAVVRTELQKRIGGYRPELPHSGDMEMWFRFAAYASVGELGAYQAVYRRHSKNMHHDFMSDRRLGDLQQRVLAIDYFLEGCGDVLLDAEALRSRLRLQLGCQAIKQASAAFNDGDRGSTETFVSLALELSPAVRQSPQWQRFRFKQKIGYRGWRVIQFLIGTTGR